MEFVFKPFILIYHLVDKVFQIPKKVLTYAHSGVLAVLDKFSIEKEKKEEEVPDILEEVPSEIKGLRPKKKSLEKDPTLLPFRYTIRLSNGKKANGTFEGHSLNEVRDFLTNEGYEVLKVEPRKKYDIDLTTGGKFKAKDLSFSLTQLSTYIKAGIALVDAVRILEKQTSNPAQRKIYQKLVYELLKGESLSTAMGKQGSKFPKLLINMVQTAELTGDLTSVLDDMADFYTSQEQTRKQMVSAMTYPVVVLVISFAVLVFIMIQVVPAFVEMYAEQDAELPGLTIAVMAVSDFISHNAIVLLLILILILTTYILLFRHVKPFRKFMQNLYMHIPVMSKIIIYNEVYNFTKTFASLLNHGVFITDSIEVLGNLTENEIYKGIINKTLVNLSKGAAISESFKGEWAFPVDAYEMIVTGENTGQLGLMMEKVADHYQIQHKAIITQLKSLMEPMMIMVLAVIVGIILLSVIYPMFGIYSKIT